MYAVKEASRYYYIGAAQNYPFTIVIMVGDKYEAHNIRVIKS